MADAFGGFLHTSPLSNLSSSTSRPPDPNAALASNCVRDHFGPVVQTVADALHARGPCTLGELAANIKGHCCRDWNQERERLVNRLNGSIENEEGVLGFGGSRLNMNKARGPESAGFVTDASHVRAALIVLLHHSLVKVSGGGGGGGKHKGLEGEERQRPDPTSPQTHYTYTFLHERARLLPRFPRYVEHAQSIIDENAAHIVEVLLVNGRMGAEETVSGAWEAARSKLWPDLENDEIRDGPRNEVLRDIVQSFRKLVEMGYVEIVKPIATNQELDDIREGKEKQEDALDGGQELEFGMDEDGRIVAEKKKRRRHALSDSDEDDSGGDPGSKKKQKKNRAITDSSDEDDGDSDPSSKTQRVGFGVTENDEKKDSRDDSYGSEHKDPLTLSLLKPHRKLLPPGSVCRVNTLMFHASLRAEVLSRLVSEMYPDDGGNNKKGKSDDEAGSTKHAGALVNAALTFAARQEHAPVERLMGVEESEEERHRRIAERGIFAPQDIVPYLSEEVTRSLRTQVGGLNRNLSTLLVRVSELGTPPVMLEVEEALGHPEGGKFEVCTRRLLSRLQDRILHRVLTSHRGLIAARIVSVLQALGHCESDALAESAMLPAKEARDILHRLHRDGYVDLFDMHVTKTHNISTAIFLWNVVPGRLLATVVNNVCTAMLNLRLRRQHEVEVGKDWMDRAKEAGSAEENVDAEDKKRYHAFCKGLERLDCACLSLDETLMVLKDF